MSVTPDADLPAGDFCIDEDLAAVDGCAREPAGWTVVHGDHVAVVVWDGDVDCDGCGRLFIDDAEIGPWCR